ncbi:transporter substrate-binding domain-containing protein [Shewanella sp. D64]|uniref:HD domain-containing phosphohydrolase n=1 Tax=unclassified Shewanella TaxID=196818 RepID=UPI0022BA6DBB|nr:MULTISPECIES: HD domain-containing phosphohydrolase [unclassified Shewanella]MEC4726137.1 transporter substrate-binding domain-containing protein [Shewanella sp. D64]MEC4737947.1 transporter substrate-binding domain-containing protein [Shewanella sp. E94]WBJ96148.1 transporter substrate-binding domain-containing protein [Shewanella sp. MTB7]
MLSVEGYEKKRVSIRFTVVSIFILATVLTAAIAIGLQYYFSQSMATQSALKYYNFNAERTSKYLSQVDTQAVNITKLLSGLDQLIEVDIFNRKALHTFAELMQVNPIYFSINLGLPNGDFYQLVNLDSSPLIRDLFLAIPDDRWVFIFVTGKGAKRIREISYLDNRFRERVRRDEFTDYDPRGRPWFINAVDGSVSRTQPYLFELTQSPGQTYSIKLPDTNAVLAVDITLSSLSRYLGVIGRSISSEFESEVYMYKPSGEVIASNQRKLHQIEIPKSERLTLTQKQLDFIDTMPVLRVSNETDWPPIDFAISGQPLGYGIDIMDLISQMTGLKLTYVNGFTWQELIGAYKSGKIELLQSIIKTEDNKQLGIFSEPFLTLAYSLATLSNVVTIGHVSDLNGHKVAVSAGWSIIPSVKRYYPEVELVEYASSYESLLAVKRGEVFAALDTRVNLHYTARRFFIQGLSFHDELSFLPHQLPGGLNILAKKDHEPLIELVNQALAQITKEQKRALRLKWLGRDSLSQPMKTVGVVPYKVLIDIGANPEQYKTLQQRLIKGVEQFVYVTSFAEGRSLFAIVVPSEALLAPSANKVLTSVVITAICMLMILPISWLFSNPIIRPITLLCRENVKIKHRRYNSVSKVQTNVKELDELADSMLEMASALKAYEESQKALMEAIIRLIAQAIDDKSPYTAGHCNRVPELGIMLANAAQKANSGPFKDFCFKNKDEYREFRMAAWLHDCGKITTPEHIVDKGTKLEANYNRIHEIRMRFEVLWRDAEIEYLKQLAQFPKSEKLMLERLKVRHEQLTDDFEFIANANVGGEYMEPSHIERLTQLASITWLRNFDDRLGLSPIEESHLCGETSLLPTYENLLSDKAEHHIPRISAVKFNPKFGIKVQVPELQYNLGELYNLSISRGTLTAEDRYKINEHVITTIKMLEGLPFPPELARVPRYASTHHETLKGTGYPRKLHGDELSILERILVIADIFEALTAADRPYKKAKPISVAVDILHKMALDEHLDIDLFRLFLSTGIYLEYANKFLNASQIDEVDINRYLS